MNDTIKFICDCCGKEHESWPAITYNSPYSYSNLSPQEKEEIAVIDQDFCVVKYADNDIDRFIRVVLVQKVKDHCENLEYGFWVSLSEKSFDDYLENFDNENHETQYFGWLSSYIPEYEFPESITTTVITKTGNDRPEIFPHKDSEHPFVKDYYDGITKEEAQKRIKSMMQSTNQIT
ncbi:DUF2199 domain-containing protein [Flavobacterium sp. AC]|uniref:DUF2199 domain-containing protein n=1 Tax=Flavobacterium azizsancarii TaxID=2961580 RepID=A0ABT4W8V6_9FLAO|nr:DUF2199 domain-containing protein [Flavobacterium azizsancarii]MDA6068921.1 DUF2199 domain-containing protein [Flavobacterium azizsancarii]